jgi:archaellum biogenesis ATPase FlaH
MDFVWPVRHTKPQSNKSLSGFSAKRSRFLFANQGYTHMAMTQLLSEALKESTPEPVWVVEEMLREGKLSALIASPGAGKSTFCRSLVTAVAQGTRFLNREVKQGKALLLSMEDEMHDLKTSLQQLGAPADEVYIGIEPPESPLAALREELEARKPSLAVIDPWGHFAKFEDSNNYDEVTGYMQKLRSIARTTRTHVLCVHHDKKRRSNNGVDDALGSRGFTAAVDTVMNLNLVGGQRVLKFSKMRIGRQQEPIRLVMDEGSGWIQTGDSLAAVRSKATENRAQSLRQELLGCIGIWPGIKQEEVLRTVSGNKQTKTEMIDALIESGEVIRSGAGRRGNPFTLKLNVQQAEAA